MIYFELKELTNFNRIILSLIVTYHMYIYYYNSVEIFIKDLKYFLIFSFGFFMFIHWKR